MERRLAAILAADMVGFSRLMEADEMGTLARQKSHRAELIDPKIDAHGGSLIKLTGDGMIAEFPSVVEAVQCAVAVQGEMTKREAESPEETRIQYRIAVNLGDVIFDDEENDVYGDGVNIAARLEALAPPGGIVVSGTAYDHLKSNVPVGYVDLGEQQVKNISTPVRVYQVVPDQAGQPVRTQANATSMARRPSIVVAGVLVALLIAAVGVWQLAFTASEVDARLPPDSPILAMPQGPKIVVLPFENLSDDPEQDRFIDGLTEDLIGRLSQKSYFSVIGRNTAFKYEGKSPDARSIGAELGVDYVVRGSIRRSEDTIRLSAQLLSTADGTQVWSKTYDRELGAKNVFAIQDELASGISESISGSKGVIPQARLRAAQGSDPKDLSSFDCYLTFRAFQNTYDPADFARSRACAEATVERDPGYKIGWVTLGWVYVIAHQDGFDGGPEPLVRAAEASRMLLKLAPDDALSHILRAGLMRNTQRWADARSATREAIKLSSNDPRELHSIAFGAVYSGMWEAGWQVWQKAVQMDPNPPSFVYWTAFDYHFHAGNLDEALRFALIIKRDHGGYYAWSHAVEAAVLAHMDRVDDAAEALSRATAMNPDFAKIARPEIENLWSHTPDYVEKYMDGLFKAGLERVDIETQ